MNDPARHPLVWTALVLLVAGCVAGCAVTTIDVDVYKGPLVNEQEVQIQQTANLAFAAKPLLAKLRFFIEEAAHDVRAARGGNMPVLKAQLLRDSAQYVDADTYNQDIHDPARHTREVRLLFPNAIKVPPRPAFARLFVRPESAFVNDMLLFYDQPGFDERVFDKAVEEASAAYPPESSAPADAAADPVEDSLNAARAVNRRNTDRIGRSMQRQILEAAGTAPPTPAPAPEGDGGGARPKPNDKSEKTSPQDKIDPRLAQRITIVRGPELLGLETRHRLYLEALEAHHDQRQGHPEIARRRNELFETLLRFAQRLTFAADNEPLFSIERSGIPGVAYGAVDAAVWGESDMSPAARSYVQILQAVGNAITVQINELQNQAAYEARLTGSRHREAAGVRAALRRAPSQALTHMEDQLATLIGGVRHRLDLPGGDPAPDVVARARAEDRRRIAEGIPELAAIFAVVDRDLLPAAETNRLFDEAGPELGGPRLLNELILAAQDQAKRVPASEPQRAERFRRLAAYFGDPDLMSAAGREVPIGPRGATARALGAILKQEAARREPASDDMGRLKERDARWAEHVEYSTAAAGLRDVRAVQAAAKAGDDALPAVVAHDRVLVLIRSELAAEKAKGEGQRRGERVAGLEAAERFAAKFPPRTAPLNVESEEDAEGVMDAVIAALRHEHIQTVARLGESSDPAKHIAEALDAAYGQRADMQYIRPASAFLRTSYPATTLQRGTRLGWKNLLAEHAGRQIPGADRFPNDPDLRTIGELDKQYWQNINRIRVAGGGNTNYVMVKDDIGNWYVKNYSADPEEIIQAAQSLALFGLGPALGTPGLLAAASEQKLTAQVQSDKLSPGEAAEQLRQVRNATRGSGGDAAATANAAATGPAVGRLVATAKGTYDAETANDLKRVKSDAGGLSQKVGDAWGQDKKIAGQAGLLDKLNAARDAAAKLHLAPVAALGAPPTAATATAAATPAPDPPRPGILVLDGARRMKQFHDDLSTRLDGVLDEAADEALKAAKEESEEAKEKLKAAEAQHTKDAQAVTDNQKGITGWEAKQKENELKPDDKKVLQDEIDTLTKEKPKLSGRAAASKRAAEEQAAKVKELTTKAERPVGDFRKELEPIVKEARKLARQAVGGAVRPLVERREQVLNQYEIELDLVGRSVAAP